MAAMTDGGNVMAEVVKEQHDFIKNMNGLCPNRVMLSPKKMDDMKEQMRNSLYMPYDTTLPTHRWFIAGMRVVEDPWSTGIEVGYVR
jgi:hypothetical protein